MAQVIDGAKIGTRGYPRHWRELGAQPPMREQTAVEIAAEKQTTENSDDHRFAGAGNRASAR